MGITTRRWEGDRVGTPALLGNSEGCVRVASLLVVVWEHNTSRVFTWEESGWRKDSARAVKSGFRNRKNGER